MAALDIACAVLGGLLILAAPFVYLLGKRRRFPR